ncbi:MAG TPA: hypothetical protein VMZ28_04930 [Kofleriaceae bacterium]|nr:hypothetical protein [Kofleriaceae bacterium]
MTPAGLLGRAAILLAAFGACHLAGWRDLTSVLSGTPPGSTLAALGGVLYLVFYFAAVIGVPVLIIAAGLLKVALRWARPD